MKLVNSALLEKPWFSCAFIALSMSLYFILCYIFRAFFGVFDVEEIGVTEVITYLFYGFGGGIIFCCAKDFLPNPSTKKSFFAIVFLYIAMLFRDLGAQAWLTTHDTVITKTRFFTNPNNPLYEKIIAASLMLLVLFVLLYVLVKHIKPFIEGIVKLEPVPWTVVTIFVWTIITQIVDRIPAEFAKATGVALIEPIRFAMKILEEGGESLLPLLIAIAFLQFVKMQNKE